MPLTLDILLAGLGPIEILPVVPPVRQAAPHQPIHLVGHVAGRLAVHVCARVRRPAHPELGILDGRLHVDVQIKVRLEHVARVIDRRRDIAEAPVPTHDGVGLLARPAAPLHAAIAQIHRVARVHQRRTRVEVEVLLREDAVAVVRRAAITQRRRRPPVAVVALALDGLPVAQALRRGRLSAGPDHRRLVVGDHALLVEAAEPDVHHLILADRRAVGPAALAIVAIRIIESYGLVVAIVRVADEAPPTVVAGIGAQAAGRVVFAICKRAGSDK